MPCSCVIGLLWGDEGKGKVIDYLARDADFVVRYAGGHNAGHTLEVEGERIILQLVPSGAMRPEAVNVIGNGVVVDPWHLREEIARLRGIGARLDLGRSLLISERAHVILPVHKALDRVAEQVRGAGRIGTTGRGIGPTYADRAARCGLRMGDLLRPELLRTRLDQLLAERAPLLQAFELPPVDAAALHGELAALGRELAPGIADTGAVLREAWRRGRRLLCEGAQGVLLDVDHGTYPYCTSSSASTGGCVIGTGLPPAALTSVTGVVKAYATRVGEGPFPTELQGDLASRLREAGHEYGSVTGRPRRVGSFDAVAVRYSAELSGTSSIFLTNLDVLSGFDPLPIAVAYEMPDGTRTERFPAYDLDAARPIREELRGWDEDITGVREYRRLPAAARAYVEAIEARVGVPVAMISVGPGREQVVCR
jgi:adenylosuccinate synthase